MTKTTLPHSSVTSIDLGFDAYHQRQLAEIAEDAIRERSRDLRKADKFFFNGNLWEPQPYEGFAVVAMADENQGNKAVSDYLVFLQGKLEELFPVKHALFPLPRTSFHQTIANILSADRFLENLFDVGLEQEFPYIVEDAFQGLFSRSEKTTLFMRLAGLSLFETAIGILGVFECQEDYERVLHFRSGFYGNEMLSKLDVKMTRPFIGHVTLAYIEHNLGAGQKQQLADAIVAINRDLEQDLYLNISRCGLRRYRHLAEFWQPDHFPVRSL